MVSSANAGVMYNYLDGVVGISTSHIWAVGYSQANFGGPSQTLIERWNGTSWRVVSSPNPGSNLNQLDGVAAVSARNIWTVGFSSNGVYGHTLIEHWDGMNWSVITSPNPGAAGNGLIGVTVLSASNIWAVGAYSNTGNVGSDQTLIDHWDGTSWSIVSSPNVASSGNDLVSVSAVSANNIWAVGNSFNSKTFSGKTLIEHWNGTRWSIVSSPNVGSEGNILNGVTNVPGTSDAWTVGFYQSNGTRTLTEFYC